MTTTQMTEAVFERSDPKAIGTLPMIQKPDQVRHLGPIDVDALGGIIPSLSEKAWAKEDEGKPNAFPCFHHTQHVLFRFIPDNRDAANFVSYVSWPLWRPHVLPVMQAAIASYGFERPMFPKAMLARLLPGAQIDLHRDGAGANLHTHKIHVPLQTNDKVFFLFDDAQVHLKFGEAYEVNNIIRHGGRNGGEQDRIHLIFEVFDAAAATKA